VNKLPWIIGGGALAAYWLTHERRDARVLPFLGPLPGRWVWPVASWNGRAPVISDGFNSPRPGVPRHGGVDIMFKRQPRDAFAPKTPNGSKLFVMPDDHPVLAASDGVVWSAMQTAHGHAVVIDHGPRKLATFYTHLDKLLITPTAKAASRQFVKAGQAIGSVGFSPLDSARLKHLHFEVWVGGPSEKVDPSFVMRSWEILDDPRATTVARNAGFAYRQIGASGEPYPQWVRDLKGKAGVYIIRDLGDAEILYVGSSSGRLYDTMTRHFQTVRHEAQEVPMT
jgi:Peptidase family M23